MEKRCACGEMRDDMAVGEKQDRHRANKTVSVGGKVNHDVAIAVILDRVCANKIVRVRWPAIAG